MVAVGLNRKARIREPVGERRLGTLRDAPIVRHEREMRVQLGAQSLAVTRESLA